MSRKRNTIYIPLIIIFAAALIIRLAWLNYEGCEGDLQLYYEWSQTLYDYGFSGFYDNAGFADYPPGYLYLLLPIGHLINAISSLYLLLPAEQMTNAFSILNPVMLLKLPAIIFDLLTALLFYLIAKDRLSPRQVLLATAFVALNPMAIFNSAVWGQVDSIFTFFLILCTLLITWEKFEGAAACFAVALALKPQAIIIGPLLLYAFIDKARQQPMYWLKRLALCIICFAVVFYLIILPFGNSYNPAWIVPFYVNTMEGYTYVSLNAYNLWWALGANWIEDSLKLGIFSYAAWGYLLVAVSLVVCGWLYLRSHSNAKSFLIGALFCTAFFMFCCRMHERYLYPSAMLFLFAYIYDRKPMTLLLGIFFSFHSLLNHIGALFWDGKFYALRTGIAFFGVAGLAVAFLWAFYQSRRTYSGD